MMEIAKAGFKECLRFRIFYFILFMAVVFILIGKGCGGPEVSHNEIQIIDENTKSYFALLFTYHGMVLWSILLCGFLASTVLVREIDEGTALLTLSRPISRTSFVVGKLLSVLAISAFNLFLLGAVFVLIFYFQSDKLFFGVFPGLLLVFINFILFALLNMMLSMFLPRIVTPMITVFLYLITFWTALPFHIEKIKYVWTPTKRVSNIHDYLPAFGDFQFLGASFIDSTPELTNLPNYLINVGFYSAAVFIIMIVFFNRKQI